MSRFGLRSCSDGLKISEEKNIRRKSNNPISISSKRNVGNQKDIKVSAHLNNNEENSIDDIKVETDEIEREKCPVADISDKLIKDKKLAAGIAAENDEDEEENLGGGNAYENKVEHDFGQLSPICKGTLVCSLPLERINEIIKKLNLNKSKIEIEKEPEEVMLDETMDNDDDEEDDVNISKHSASNIKNLCLYCDRKFSSHKMQLKHVDKFHCLQQDRRCSGRNAQLQQQAQTMPRKRKPTLASHHFPGCNFCHKTKGQTQQPVILPAAELSSLFLHLTDCHTDKYFGCKTCVVRFQNITKLSQHMEIVHKSLPFAFDENSSKSKDNDTDSLISIDKLNVASSGERSKLSLKRHQRSQKSLGSSISMLGTSVAAAVSMAPQCSTAITPNTSVIGAEEPILSRLGLTQNRLPNNRKGVRLRRDKLLPEMLLKSEHSHHHASSTNFPFGPTTSLSASTSSSTTTCSPKLRGKSLKSIGGFPGDTTADVIFRVPTRNDLLSCVFDDNFYKEVVSNVRNNLLLHLDGKIMGNSMQDLDATLLRHSHQPQIRSTLVKSPIVVTTVDSEIHAATSLAAITAFPTLLTAEQFGADTGTSKIRRPHTKNSWKWKWDSVKKFKLINEGGKIIKKMKHPMLGLRDLSKLDMWTQLSMRQKHELQQQQKINLLSSNDYDWHQATGTSTGTSTSSTAAEISIDPSREEKQRVNDQLNFILDMRLLPHIILEQNEQAIIKLENDEFGIAPSKEANEDCGDSFMEQTFADEGFLSMLNLLPNYETQSARTKLVLSGEWARPRCYLCICCGCKFEKLKSLEEHKMFRHSHILSTHYEVVGRELLNGNLLRHLFLPKKALSRYGNESDKLLYTGAARRLFWHKNETIIREITNNEESSDSLQSMLHSCVTNSPSLKNSSSNSSTEDCDLDSKLQLIDNSAVVSPTHSIQSCSSSSSSVGLLKGPSKISSSLRATPVTTATTATSHSSSAGYACSKCGRKTNGVLDLYRHMLDCSGDYIWSLAKKRKYRYYCGSKKRRPCNKHSILELRKNKGKTPGKSLSISNDNTNEEGAISSSNYTKIKTSPRSRPSDAESIKKMLENLPAKRVCKKIFPTLSKAKKKSVKNIKPKLLGKHKIYHSLRKTRVRQLQQAAKILSKTKSQIKGSRKMVTRSSATTLASKVKQNRSNKTRRNIKMAMSKNNSERKVSANSNSNQENVVKNNNKLEKQRDEVDCSSIKTEKDNTKEEVLLTDQTKEPDKSLESEKSVQLEKLSDDLITRKNTKDNLEESTEPGQQILGSSKQTTAEVNATIGLIANDIKTNIPDNNTIVHRPVCANVTPAVADGERNPQTNIKGVKRSKRISDCIAMLTGKLEEKLKTEQKILVPPALPQVATPVAASELKSLTSSSPKPLQTQTEPLPLQPTPKYLPKTAEIIEPEKCSPKKTPKRKALSRRIIKTNVIESSPLTVSTTTNLEIKAASHVSPKMMRPVEIMPPPKELLPPKVTRTLTPELVAARVAAKNMSEHMFLPGENKRSTVNCLTSPIVNAMPPPPIALTLPAATATAAPTPSTIMPKMPLFIPLENVRPALAAPHMPTHMPLPMPLPVPVPVPIPIETIAQTSAGAIPSVVPAAGPKLLPSPVIPILAAVPARLAVPPALQLTVSSFNPANAVAEPLNLSNSSKNVTKQSQDLSCAGSAQRMSGMPARRQTICGFEVRNFAVFDEIEPLDLSKKPRPAKPANPAAFPTRHMELSPLLLPPPSQQQPQQSPVAGITNETTVLAFPPLTAEALLNKPFYSNLDLLRIPQVRNPVGGQPAAGNLEPIQTVAASNTSPVVATAPAAKTTNKKRSKPTILPTPINTNHLTSTANASDGLIVNTNTTNSNAKINNAKDSASTNSKKEAAAKNKPVLRMDEEVINHIDDAINSVINAVKASLDSEEALKAQQLLVSKNPMPPAPATQPSAIQIKTTDDVNANKESGQEFKFLAAARRNMRSKTLDCRPAALGKACNKPLANNINLQLPDYSHNADVSSTTSITSPTILATTVHTGKSKTNKNAEIIKCLDNKVQMNEHITNPQQPDTPKESAKEATENSDKEPKLIAPLHSTQTQLLEAIPLKELFNQQSKSQNEATTTEQQFTTIVENSSKQNSSHIPDFSAVVTEKSTAASNVTVIVNEDNEEAKNISPTVTTKPLNLLDLEQMSNNNNTSSGFHSSAQSDQQTSVMSNSTSALSLTATETGTADTKKKQRRRRKNELAAIVADQLLESFKLDKARRDNLKKLENLAYEKSEDLLLTGMLLMSSTKRNVNSGSSSNLNAQVEPTESPSPANPKRSGKTQRTPPNTENQKQNEAAENKTTTIALNEKSFESDKDPLDVSDAATLSDNKKNNKQQRRQYRRRGKTLDNENISKLKSSLESFSIDIERQLTEYEAKNVNVFKNVPSNENGKQTTATKNQAAANTSKSSIVLRPSLLSSVALEISNNQDMPQTASKTSATDSNKTTIVSSRDPRLNKNIHKEDEKHPEAQQPAEAAKETAVLTQKNSTGPEEIGDLEEDNYLTEIAKNVNEKIMSTENEEFAFKNDGFELVNDMGMDDSNSKFSRPPTSMSVRSAPNFNDDRSNFGSICDENTNTEVMDMDLDDEMSVYTSYSQDLGRGRGRRRRRRRSILLTRKPKKRASSRDLSADKIECILCKKVFYSANSLSKHNMTLAHVSKVSEQEYLLSKSHTNLPNLTNADELQTYGSLGPYARRTTRRNTISEPPMQSRCETNPSPPVSPMHTTVLPGFVGAQSTQLLNTHTTPDIPVTAAAAVAEDLKPTETPEAAKPNKALQKSPNQEYDVNISANNAYNGNSRLNLNPDERLFFECCNILKSAETPRLNNAAANGAEECNIDTNFSYAYNQDKLAVSSSVNANRPPISNLNIEPTPMRATSGINANHDQLNLPPLTHSNVHAMNKQQSSLPIQTPPALFRDPQHVTQSNCYNKNSVHDNRNARSPTYSAISHLSAVTNTTSRFKTKAAMKGYENVNIDLNHQQESKSRTICKLTELAEIALGNEDKTDSPVFSTNQNSLTPSQVSAHINQAHQLPKVNIIENVMRPKGLETPEYATSLVDENIRNCNAQLPARSERTKNNETRSSTSSKTIMHSSIIKAAVEEHQKAPPSNKIIIPDRPFKNIGLEEKETITFQKPKTPAVNLLTDDNNSVSTGSFSDRDDYDFGSLSCDEEVSVRESNDKNHKNNTTESSSESSRATAKTFENKSLIMGRIFKNASTKAALKTSAVNTVKVKSVGVQKDQTPIPKADLNQLFDELRGNSGVEVEANDRVCNSTVNDNCPLAGNSKAIHKPYTQQRDNVKSFIPAASPPAVVSSTTVTLPTKERKPKARVSRAKSNAAEAKSRKNITKLQSELGMSPDEIKKLIDEGQRKSKRRCATNRPKKLIEMWSSDEYEEFLSTKDIIALIEEKEQQEEKRKKRKNSLNASSTTAEVDKEKEIISDVTSSTKEPKRRNTRRMSLAADHPDNILERPQEPIPPKVTKTKKGNNKRGEEPVSTTATITNASELSVSKKFEKPATEKTRGRKPTTKNNELTENSSTLNAIDNNNVVVAAKKRDNNKNATSKAKTQKTTPKAKKATPAKESTRTKYNRRQYDNEESSDVDSVNDNLDNDNDDDEDDDDDDFLISELKTKQNKARAAATKQRNKKSMASNSAAIVTSTANAKSPKQIAATTRETSSKKRAPNSNSNSNAKSNNTNVANAASTSNAKNQQQQLQQQQQQHNQTSTTPAKTKRKNLSNQSPPRRKRLATEKLYYWSSSSDEEFGLIDNNKSNPPPPVNFDNNGEQYQKHGWIVGDSHKKLVTLLAIAKGNKKIDSGSGVKKNIGKKRN